MDFDFNYQEMMQDALLYGIVKGALAKVAADGLPGDHHFYIVVRTDYPGAQLSEELRRQYPEEIVIVLQHRFWNLRVEEDFFEVDLTFNDVPQRLKVPFKAVKGFFDPSVEFGLQFDVNPREGRDVVAAEVGGLAPSVANSEPDSEEADAVRGQIVSLDAFRKN